MLKQGLIQVYTGTTEHFNFAPIGLSLRAAGQGLRILNACFTPHELSEGIDAATTFLRPNLVVDYSAARAFSGENGPDGDVVLHAFQSAREAALDGRFDMVIFNGIHPLLNRGIIPFHDVRSLMAEKPSHVELVFSGPGAPAEMTDAADLVTEMVVSRSRPPEEENGLEHRPGCIEVVTGNGKGKTTYCLGKAMLSSCTGILSAFLQFIKSPKPYGEVKAVRRLPRLHIDTMGEGFLMSDTEAARKKHLDAARLAWERCLREIFSLKYGLVALDEINTATYYGLVHADRVREMLFLKPRELHLLLSGRNAHAEITGAASCVIEMREIKHPFRKGIKARKGIEY